MEAEQRRAIIEQALEHGGIRCVHWATETAHPGKGGMASLGGDYMRLVMVLEGRRHVRVMRENQARQLLLAPGDCMVVGPHSWLVTDSVEPFRSVGVALEARNPRFVLARQEFRDRAKRSIVPGAEVEIVPGLCEDLAMTLAASLLAARTSPGDELYCRRLAETLWLRLARFAPSPGGKLAGKANVTYGAAEHFVRENFSRPIDREQVARHLRISPSHVTRLFLGFAGESFGGFLLRIRLESARHLLRDPRLTVSEVAYLAGFTSVNYFVRAYRGRYRVTPGRDRGADIEERVVTKPLR